MYNEDVKKAFIRSFTKSLNTAKVAQIVFNGTEPFEKIWGSDLCTKSAEDLQPIIDKMGLRNCSRQATLRILREYTKWCLDSKIEGACDGMMHVDTAGLEKIKTQMVSSPYHLQKFLNAVFDPEIEETIDNVYRCYLWIAYLGLPEKALINIKDSDVNLHRLVISYEGTDFPIVREALPAFTNAVGLTSFLYKHPKYAVPIRIDRAEGDLIMRCTAPEVSMLTTRPAISRKIAKAIREGKTNLQLSYHRSQLSGLFFRAYEMERAGVSPDFSDAAKWDLSDAQRLQPSAANKQKIKQRSNAYLDDYLRWKLAFEN